MPYADKDKQRKFQREWAAARRAAWIQANGPCACGSWESIEVDHIDRSTKVTHAVWTWSAERREEELKKCRPLCKACHKKRTREQLQTTLQHGTYAGYRKGCKCAACVEAARLRASRWQSHRQPRSH